MRLSQCLSMNVDAAALRACLKVDGWETSEVEPGMFKLETLSPSGRDIVLKIYGNTLEELSSDVEEVYKRFDPEEQAIMWRRTDSKGAESKGASRSLRLLLDDAEAVKDTLGHLAAKLTNIWEKEHQTIDKVYHDIDYGGSLVLYNEARGRLYYAMGKDYSRVIYVIDASREELARATVKAVESPGAIFWNIPHPEPSPSYLDCLQDCTNVIKQLLNDPDIVSHSVRTGSAAFFEVVKDVFKSNYDIYCGSPVPSDRFLGPKELCQKLWRLFKDSKMPSPVISIAAAAKESKEASAEIAASRTPEQPSREESR